MSKSTVNSADEPRVAIGGIWHETNTFATGLTRYEDFESYQLARKDELIERYTGTNTELGGVIRGATDFDLQPTLFAAAVPSGTIEYQSFIQLLDELTGLLQEAMPLDAVVLALHGAAVVETIDDADAYILAQVRKIVKDAVPIVATFDYHANLSDDMVSSASVLIGYDTYPHTDMADRGEEAIKLIRHFLAGQRHPICAHRKLPLLTSPLKQQTDQPPMREVMQKLQDLEKDPTIVSGSVAMGFPYSDVSHLGASVVVYGENQEQIDTAADSIATTLWNSRQDFQQQLLSVETCVELALNSAEFPVVIVEPADNIGGGSAGDGTTILDALLKSNAKQSVIVICDPEAVAVASQAGVGCECSLRIGGKTDNLHGPPVQASVIVKAISGGEYTHKGTYMTGYITSMGQTALVESQGVQIVVTSRRSMPFDAEQLRCLGIEPEEQKIIVVKAAIAWKAAYGKIAKRVLAADTPGVCAADLTRLNYEKRPKPLYPLEQSATHFT